MSRLSPHRLPAPWGCLIDRNRPVQFTFEGRKYQGFEGDTLASALAANGVLVLSRSFKYHRPRGSFSFSGMDANAYVQVKDQPNVPADQLPITEGLEARAQNVWGSLRFDLGAAASIFSRFLPPGFYYRAFFRPKGIWPFWEWVFRRAAGLGRICRNTARLDTDKQYLFADVAVLGAGPAGLKAAIAAGSKGASVVLVDEAVCAGGALGYAGFQRDRQQNSALLKILLEEVAALPNIRLLMKTTCSGWFADNWLALHNGERLFKLRARQVVAATGSIEQPMVFRNNDLPGVLSASAMQRLMRLYGLVCGKRIAIVTANLEGYDVAMDLLESGMKPAVLVDMNTQPADPDSWSLLKREGVETYCGQTVVEATAGRSPQSISGIVIKTINKAGSTAGKSTVVDCDCLVTSVGYSPLAQLVCQAGGRMVYKDKVHSLVVDNCPDDAWLAGSINHSYALGAVLREGEIAGLKAAQAAGFDVGQIPEPMTECGYEGVNHPWPIFPHAKGKDFVDFDEDQVVADLEYAVADGFDHPELAKRYTTVAMGPSQGRLSALNALRIVRQFTGQAPDGTEMTTQRPPFKPLSLALLAGRSFQPERLTPMHNWHTGHGAKMMPAGLWQRPAFYGSPEERPERIDEEVAAIRNKAGLIDVSTLGGIELRGPDSAEFLNRMYTFTYLQQEIGKSRYLLMTDDSGSIIDDGVAGRLSRDHFYITTTTTGSDSIYRNMQRHLAEWRLRVSIVNVTTSLAAINIAGPMARLVLQKLESDLDYSPDAFPYLGVRRGTIAGIPVTAMRVGFVGELGYELHLPWSRALSVWEQLLEAGDDMGIRPVGVEAQRVLRLEKGHIIIGQDTDGLTTPDEAGLGWAVDRKKPYFVGGPALTHKLSQGLDRQLVGFTLLEPSGPLPEECHLVLSGQEICGRVTSIARSNTLDAVIGLAYVGSEQARIGSTFEIKIAGGRKVLASTVALPFYDPKNLRQAM